MSRYIDADKLVEQMLERYKALTDEYGDYDHYTTGYDDAIDEVESFPAADVVEVVHAYWKEINHITESKRGREIHSKLYNCSNCDAPNGRKKTSYCHWCGAKMDGKRSENGKGTDN